MMRIAVFHNLPSGGAKRSLHEEMKRLCARHTLDVFTTTDANHTFADIRPFANRHLTAEFKPRRLLNSPFGRLNQLIRLADLRSIRALYRRMAVEIDRGDYDALLVHPCRIEGCPSVIRYLQRTPAVYYCHEPLRILYEEMPWRPYNRGEAAHRRLLNQLDPLPGIYRRELRRGDRLNVRSARRVLVNSEYIQAAARQAYDVETEICYHGVDADLFHPLGLSRENMVFSVGSLTPLKGFDFLIEALATIPECERPELVIASNFQNPPERDYLEQAARRFGVRLQLLENVSDERLVDLYNRAAAVVYAPVREPFGFVSLEAMACGTPVVGVAEGGLLETILPGQTGILVERDPTRFGARLRELLASPDAAAAMGTAGREHVLKNWTWDKAADELARYLSF